MENNVQRLELMPTYIKVALESHDVSTAEIQLIAGADLLPSGEFGETWVVATKAQVLILSGKITGGEEEKSKKGDVESERQWQEEGYLTYELKDIESFDSESLASSGMLTAQVSGQAQVFCRYSNTQVRKFGMMAKLLNKMVKGKELTEEDFKDDHAPAYCPKCGMMYPDQTRKVCPKCLDRRAIFMRVLSFVPRYKVAIGIILLCMFASSALNLLNPYIGGNIFFDDVLKSGGKYEGKILMVVLVMFGSRLLALLINIFYLRINAGITAEIIYDLKTEIFTAMQRLSLSFYSNRQTGALMTHVNNDANNLQYFFHDGLPFFIVNSVTLIGIGVTMTLVNWKLALCVFLPVPFIVVFVRKLFPRMWRLFHRTFRRNSSMNSLLNDTLTGARVVKGFGKEETEVNRFEGVNEGVRVVNADVGRMTSTAFPLLYFIMGIGGFIVWGLGGWQVAKGSMTFGTLMTFTGYIGMIYGPLQFMTQIVQWWTNCMNSAQRIFEILDSVSDVPEPQNPVRVPKIEGEISIKNISFSYEPNKPIVQDINLDIKAGEMLGVVGHSGAGKSTLMNLITRLYDVEEGSISIDGTNVKEIATKDLRTQIGMVLQETYLFMGSIAENIAYAKPDATKEEIIQAAKAANAHDFIIKLPEGYDTVIGRRGQNLSGGERQRVSIARAILQNPRILILDEATASLDTETEGQIQEALERLIKGRTTISIAHRLSTLRNADRLVVIEKGKIVEEGTHSELAKKKGVYFTLLQKQSEALKIQGVGE